MNQQLAATTAAGAFSFFMPIAKIDKAKRTVSGYASTPSIDSDGEIVSLKAVRDALPGYMQYGNIREMHKISAVGVAKEANMDEKGLYLTAKIVDDAAWNKCVEGVYKGFSIGGQKLLKTGNTITKIDMAEISVVDRPANPDCKIDVIKAHKPVPAAEAEAVLVKIKPVRTPEATATLAMAKAVKNLIKGAEDPVKPVTTDNTSVPEDVATLGKGKEPEVPPASPKAKIKKAKKEARERGENQIGKTVKVKYRDRMAKAFSELETLELVTNPAQRGAPKASAPAFLDIKKVATGDLSVDQTPSFLSLGKPLTKGMGPASSLTYAFSSIRDAQRSLMLEGRDEKDGKDQGLAKRLGSIAKELAGVIGDKALHEGDEAVTMTDVDDKWVNQSLGKAKKMSTGNVKDMIKGAVMEALFGSASPEALLKADKATMKDCIKGVKDNMKEAKKARKSSMEDIEKAHGMLKVNYLAKAAKKPEDKDPDFDSGECMKALSGAYASMQKAATFEKAAKDFLAKADSMASQSPTSGTGDYIVPAGVKELSISDLAEGGPPPLYESTTVYPGKANNGGDLKKYANKDGLVSVEIAELIARNAELSGQVETLGNQPRGGRRPYGFNMAKMNQGFDNNAETNEARGIIFAGVDMNAIGSGNEELHKAASARAVGNLILAPKLGRSILDPSFKGTAGIKH